ncbi:MAG: hypothetical protein GKR88_08025 [Flavobacteriaceae bacterium]|nr:MAG: hypothetical protein GKR88_03910 [Flavobacteriaceae bacterium]QMU64243.1 MAG: hypothetical protein GKR88_08025 [Flavobacteriaceae bacterium]
MEDTSIIFFGKPDGFESFGFKPQGVKSKVDHFEPSLKLESKHQDVFHTFTKNGYSYLELYSFAKAYNAGRDGIVIGVAIKSNKEIAVNDNNFKILNGLLSHFKKQALSGKMFNSTKISDMVSSFSLDDKIFSDFEFTADYSNEHGTLPLFLEDYESKINQISECRKSYSNVYVSNEKNIFNTKLNNRFLHKFGNKFYTISNSQLIEYKEPVRTKPTHTTKTSTDNVTDKLKSDILREKSKYVDLESKLIAFRKSSGKKIKALAITSAVLLLSLGAFFLRTSTWMTKRILNLQVSLQVKIQAWIMEIKTNPRSRKTLLILIIFWTILTIALSLVLYLLISTNLKRTKG